MSPRSRSATCGLVFGLSWALLVTAASGQTLRSLDLRGNAIYVHGAPTTPGATLESDHGRTVDLVAHGTEFGGHCNEDQGRFASVVIEGDFDVMVQVASVTNHGEKHFYDEIVTLAKAGIMAREDDAPGARFVGIWAVSNDSPGNDVDGYQFDLRKVHGAWLGNQPEGAEAHRNDPRCTYVYGYASRRGLPRPFLFERHFPDVWLRLQRRGQMFSAWISRNGRTWEPTTTPSYTADLAKKLHVGVALSAAAEGRPDARAEARFQNLCGLSPDRGGEALGARATTGGAEIPHPVVGRAARPRVAAFWPSGGSANTNLQSESEAWGAWRGRKVDMALAYPVRDAGWAGLHSTTSGQVAAYTDRDIQLIIQISPFPSNVEATYAALAAGAYDAQWRDYGTRLKAREDAGFRPVIVSLAWEANGTYMFWGGQGGGTHFSNPAEFIAGFRRIVTQLTATYPNVLIAWVMNGHNTPPAIGADSMVLYPGDAFVNYIGVDYYDHFPSAASQAEFDAEGNQPDGVWWFLKLARSRGKKFLCPEWGIAPGSEGNTTGDNERFVDWMMDVFRSASATGEMGGETYFDDPCGGGNVDSDLIGGCNPKTAACYRRLFAEPAPDDQEKSGLR